MNGIHDTARDVATVEYAVRHHESDALDPGVTPSEHDQMTC